MKSAIALGVAAAALVTVATATPLARIVVGGPDPVASFDADQDGWLTRAEASAGFDRVFDRMDSNHDGRLDRADRRAHEVEMRVEHGGHGMQFEDLDGEDCTRRVENEGRERRVTIICNGGDEAQGRGERRVIVRRHGEDLSGGERAEIEREMERHVERAEREAERAERNAERLEQDAERLAQEAERLAERAHREVRRHVIMIDADGPPAPPLPPSPPMFMMLLAHAEEADLNNDGALSREEFRNQHLRFFDAGDANNDGRVRFDALDLPEPPEPPEAPEPPEPPTPPNRR
jgi:EF hand